MKRLATLLLALLMLTGCGAAQPPEPKPEPEEPPIIEEPAEPQEPEPSPQELWIADRLSEMTLEEKIGQLFLAFCPSSGGAQEAEKYSLGGFLLLGSEFEGRTADQVLEATGAYLTASRIPMLIAVDEEGGSVCRVSQNSQLRSSPFNSPRWLYKKGGYELISSDATEKAQLLRSLGINLNLAPVCDVTLKESSFMYKRSFGIGAEETAEYVRRVVNASQAEGCGCVLKHYPGYGEAKDSHTDITYDDRTLEAIQADLLPFKEGIKAGAGAIMVSHNIIKAIDPEAPASLSPAAHQHLRQELDFEGVIMTDDLGMRAIKKSYGAEEAAVLAILAGNDMLCTAEYASQIPAVAQAVRSGRVSEEQINASAARVILWKMQIGIIAFS